VGRNGCGKTKILINTQQISSSGEMPVRQRGCYE